MTSHKTKSQIYYTSYNSSPTIYQGHTDKAELGKRKGQESKIYNGDRRGVGCTHQSGPLPPELPLRARGIKFSLRRTTRAYKMSVGGMSFTPRDLCRAKGSGEGTISSFPSHRCNQRTKHHHELLICKTVPSVTSQQ